MGKVRTHYDNLRIARTADQKAIKAAFRSLSQKHHPDKHPENREAAEEIFKMISRAYEVLSDPVKRKEHDEWIARQEAKPAQAAKPPPYARRASASSVPRRGDGFRRGAQYGGSRSSTFGAGRARHRSGTGDNRSSSILKAMVLCRRVESSGGMIAFISMLSGVLAAATYAIVTLYH